MKINKIMLTLFILLAILTATAVSASEDVENMTAETPLEEIESSDVDIVTQTHEEEQLEEKTDFDYNKDEILGEVSEDVIANESSTDLDLNVRFPKTLYGDFSNYFEAYIPESADGVLKLYINGKIAGEWNDFEYPDDDNSFKINVENPQPTNTWQVNYTGDSRYPDTSEEGTFEFKWVEIPEVIDIGDSFHIDLEGQEGVLIFSIDGKQVFNDFFNGEAYVSSENLSVGNHNYEIILYDNSNKILFDETGTFKVDYSFNSNVKEDGYPLVDKLEITIRLPEDATGNVRVSYNGANFTAEVNNGLAYVTLRNLELGEKEIIFTYLGDDKYPQKTVRDVISIEGYAIIPYENPGMFYISLTLPSDAKGKLNISLLDEEESIKKFLASIDLVDGNAQYILPPGNHYIRAEYNGTDYNVEPLVYSFNVVPYIKVPDFVILGENITIEVFASNASEQFEINIDDKYSCPFYLNEIGRATIDVGFDKYSDWINFRNPHKITVFYNNTKLKTDFFDFVVNLNVLPGTFAYPIEFGFDKSTNLTVKFSEYAKGNISVYAMDPEYQEHVLAQNVSVSGNAIVPLSAEKPGWHELRIIYVDEKYGEYSTMTTVYVPKPDAGSNVTIPQTVTSDTLEINLPKNATGSILAIIDGKSQIYNLENGLALIDLSAIPVGPHNLTIKYRGDENYEGFEKTAVFTVKSTSSVTIEPVTNVTYGEPVVVKYLIVNRTIHVTVTVSQVGGAIVDNLNYTLADDNVTIYGLAAGNYRIFIWNNADDNYNASSNNTCFTVSKADSTLDVTSKVNEYGIICIEAVLDGKATGNVTFVVKNESGDVVAEDTEDILNGIATFDDLVKYAKGNYNYAVTYNGDSNYKNITKVSEAPVVISKDYISPKTTQLKVEGAEINVTVDLGVNAAGKVHVVYPSGYVDNVTIENGKVNFYAVFMSETGPLSVVLDYDGDDNYYGFFEYFVDFTIKKATFVTAKPISVVYKNNAKWTINLKDADNKAVSGQTIKVTVNGKTYTAKTNSKGNAVVTIPANMVPKAYTAKIVFVGTALLEDDFDNVKFTVKKATPKLTAKKKTFKAKTKVKKYTIVLKDHKKKAMKKVKVTLKVKGKKYTVKTNKKGKAVFKIKNLKKKGTFKAKISIKATKYFNKVTKTVKIKVKK